MTATPRNLLLGSLFMFSAAGIASCTSSDAGKTLSVTAVYGSPQLVAGGTAVTTNPVIVYLGTKTLAYTWTVDLPPAGEVVYAATNTKNATFTFNQLGDYTVRLLVYESDGTISETSNGIYRVSAFGILTASVTAPAITGVANTSGFVSGSSSIAVSVSGGRAPYSYLWSTPPSGATLSSVTSAAPTLTVTNASPGSVINLTCTVTDSESTPQTIVLPVSIPVSASG